ncbi:golgin subfamily B member 1-like isoform X2 [Clinocottus analis]|uniref:golgin subfamily B member 1-like isoform X2 n=1 Tax=Clinocottus analis TaxID=304258 RepID=UPI0035C09A5A
MLKWLSGEEGEPGPAGPGSPRAAGGGEVVVAVEEMAERLSQTERLVTQLKELIREKDAALHSKDDQMKVEKESWESRLSKLRLQNKAKVTSLTSQLEELQQQQGGTPSKKGSEGGEQASRGKIVLLKKKLEDVEQQLAVRREELQLQRKEAEAQRQRGEEMDAMLAERDRKLAEKEAYIIHLQGALAGDQPPATPAPQQQQAEELQLLVQSLTRKVGEAEERFSLLQEQAAGLQELLASEKDQFLHKENMYKQNIQTFKDIIIQKDQQLLEVRQMHEQELFRLAAKSDASNDLDQLLKALKQKLHEKEEVLLGKTQVIDVLQGEVDGRDQQIKDLVERLRRLHVERESLASKMEAEKHVMRAQLRDLMEKQQAEAQRAAEQHRAQMDRAQHELLGQLDELRRASDPRAPESGPPEPASVHRIAELEARSKQKTEEAGRSEAKFLKMKAWSKSRIRQLEEELKKSQAGVAPPDLTGLRGRVTALEEEREENLWKVEQYEELKAKNDMLEAKLVVYEEQQRSLQADLEQFTKRAASQASESGSADEAQNQNQVLEWQEMVTEAAGARDRAREEKASMALRISHLEEEREALASRQQELEEQLTRHRAGKMAAPARRSLQEDFEFDGQASFQDPRSPSEATPPMEGENMGGWWPEHSSPDTEGLRSVVEELELERNQLQEQILSLEERCQDLEDRLQLQARIESLQTESERLQGQLSGLRLQQSRDAENHQLLVGGLNEQLKGLSSTQECLESSLIEKENTLAKTSEKLQLIDDLRESLGQKEIQCKDASEKLLQAEHALENVSRKCSGSEKRCTELKAEVAEVTQKLSALKEKTQKQEVAIETLQTELDQTTEELDKLNSAHLQERAQLIHDLQGCEREMDRLKDALLDKEEELRTLSGNVAEHAERLAALKLELELKDESLVRAEDALSKAEREAAAARESQTTDQRELAEKAKDAEAEVERLTQRSEEDERTIRELRGEIQKQLASHQTYVSESETRIASLGEQLAASVQQQQQRAEDGDAGSEQLRQQLSEREQTHERELKSVKDEQNKLLEKHGGEMRALSERLEEQTRREELVRGEIREKLETIETLENQLKAAGERAEAERRRLDDELRERDAEKEKLSGELKGKTEHVSKLKSLVKSAKAEKKQLQDRANGLTEELRRQKQDAEELGGKMASALELNRTLEMQAAVLAEEKERLELDVAGSAALTLERDSLRRDVSSLQTKLSQSDAAVEELRRDKEDLTRALDQSSSAGAEILLAKTNECGDLSRLLREREEEAERLRRDQRSQTEAQQVQEAQLQEALSLLREREAGLEAALKEKEAALAEEREGSLRLRGEVAERENAVTELRAEAASLHEERSRLRQLNEEREEALRDAAGSNERLQEELERSRESVSRLTAERSSLLEQHAELQIQTSENQKMIDGLLREKEALASAEEGLKKILEESERSNSARLLEKASDCASMSTTLREREAQLEALRERAGVLDASLNERQNQLLQLRDTVSALQEQGVALKAGLLEKDAALQREAEEGRVRREEVAALKALVSQSEERREAEAVALNDGLRALTERNARVESELQKTLTESSGASEEVERLKAAVRDADAKLQAAHSEREGLNSAVRGKEDSLRQQEHLIQQLTGKIAEQEQQLERRALDDAGSSEKASALEESIRELRGQVEGLSSESSLLRNALAEKEQQSVDYRAQVERLRSSLQSKEAECEGLQQRASLLEESVTTLDGSLRLLTSEAEDLKKALEEKEAALSDRAKSLQDAQRRADEASLFKTQFVESAESVSRLQSQIQLLSAESGNLKTSAEETQSAFDNLREKYGVSLEELRDARERLSQATAEASDLRTSLEDAGVERWTATATIEALRGQLSLSQDLNAALSKEKDEALASHQAGVSLLTVELERLKSQHLHVVAKMNALTENLEQREMALHAINSQYTSQAKQASQLVSEMQKLEQQNKRLSEEMGLSKEEHQRRLEAAGRENSLLQEQLGKHLAEREELERRHRQASQVQMERQSSSLSRATDSLQAEVSAKDEEVSRLKENIEKIEQVLQDSEKEWLLVLEREKQDKKLLAEQLNSVENEMKSKDVKVDALKGDLDGLQEKLAEASAAIGRGSDQLCAKESEASASRVQLEKVLASVQEKENVNVGLRRALRAAERDLQKLVAKKNDGGGDNQESSVSEGSAASLQDAIKRVEESHRSEVDALREELEGSVGQLQTARDALNRAESSDDERNQQIALLKQAAERLQTRLDAEVETGKEAAAKHSSTRRESQAKDERLDRMSIQVAQQKELLAGLSQQLRDRDASIGQLIEAASSERMKLGEERKSLAERLESLEREREASAKRLEESEERLSRSLSEIEAKESEKLELVDRNDELTGELATVAKERDAVKKKLQAALVVRKDLLKKIERHENQKEESENAKSEVSLLRDELEAVASRAQAAAEKNQENVSLLERTLLEKEGEILRLQTESESLVEQLETEMRTLRAACDEKEACLSEAVWTLTEKSSLLEQLQAAAAEREDAFERDRTGWLRRSEELQKEIESYKEDSKDKSSSAAADLESELAQTKLEKAKIQKKAQAALLARKETLKKAQEQERKWTQELADLKDDYKALLERRCQQTNELNAVQLELDEKVRELEELRRRSSSNRDELDELRRLVEERDGTLQDLKVSLAEKESRCRALSNAQAQLEDVQSKFESVCLEVASKDEALAVAERRADALKLDLQVAESRLEKAHAEEFQKYQEEIQVTELKSQQEKQALLNELERMHAHEDKYHLLLAQNNSVLEKSDQMKEELEALASQKSLEVLAVRQTAAETEQRLSDDKNVLTEELEKAQRHCSETRTELDSLKQDKEHYLRLIGELGDELTALKENAKESRTVQWIEGNEALSCSSCRCAENFEEKLKQRDDALSLSQAQVSEREGLISALESQLQHQIKTHESAIEKMRTEAAELQTSGDDRAGGQSKAALVTRRLQAALVSRKELLRENATLKEEAGKLSAERDAREAECRSLESSAMELKQRNEQLESAVSSLTREKDELRGEADSVFADNRSLSAACESLKLTIESVTQQKEAFACQLESLKDSQTDELSAWKSKHGELKQDYESLLRAYENVSSEMDKMRQLLEGAKRERQEALRKVHSREAEMEILDERAREAEEENERIKEKMREFSKEKRQKMEQLEEENQKMRKELTELEEHHKATNNEDQQWEAETRRLGEKLTESEAENNRLSEKLEEARRWLEEKHSESNAYASNMQLKLDEALTLNNSLTAQIEAQKTELGAQLEIDGLLQKEKQHLCERFERLQNDHELQLGKKDDDVKKLKEVIDKRAQESISLNEKVRILEDDKSLLQEELENFQEASDKVKNENEHLETVIQKNAERLDELSESVAALQTQNAQLSSQLAASKETSGRVRQEKEAEQLKLVREFEEKLKTVQRGSEGSKNVTKELQELLREKHREIKHLQQNCIQYQEVILDFESAAKSSSSAREHLERELKKSSERTSASEERRWLVEAEMAEQAELLREATEKILRVESERDQLALDISRESREAEDHNTPALSPTVDERQFNSYLEDQLALQQQIEDLKELKDKESQKVHELRQRSDSQDLQMDALKRSAETTEAKLSALTAAPQGVEASGRWDDLYQKTLHEKDSQLLEQGFVIKRFLEDMRVKDKEANELRVTKSRLERTLGEYSVAAAAQQRQLFLLSASNAELSDGAELAAVRARELAARAQRLEQDKSALNRLLADKEGEVSRTRLNLQQVEKTSAEADARLLLLQSLNDRLRADFEKQEGVSLQLKTLLHGKDAEISSLLSCRDGQTSGYLEQLQANHRAQVAVYEDRLASSRYQREKADKELRGLEATVRNLQIKANRSIQEKEQASEKMESFKNSMVSLQSERERLASEYRILEAKSQLGLKGKDEEGGATKGLKHEIRKLLHQMDDLNSENAMLRAQLVRYREDLNQVLFLKDNQQKVLLKKQQDVIKDLENQKAAAEKQLAESRSELRKEVEASRVLSAETSQLKAQVSSLEADALTFKQERAATDEGKVIADLREAVAAKAAECNNLQQKLLSQKVRADELRDKMQQVEKDTDKSLSEAEDKYNGELDAFEREAELTRTARETADLRTEELAGELLEMERRLSEATTQSRDARAQSESMRGAMAALQNDRDQLIQDFKVLRNGYDEELREARASLSKAERGLRDAASDLAASAKERDVFARTASGMKSKDAHTELSRLLEELSGELSAKEREAKRVALENEALGRQLSAFSRSMASLQNDRERLMDELAGAKRAIESRQGSSPEAGRSDGRDGDGLETRQKTDELQQSGAKTTGDQLGSTHRRSDTERKDALPVEGSVVLGGANEAVRRLEAEKLRLHGDLQRCLMEIQQRDQYYQQLNLKMQQAVEEKGAAAAQLRAISQTLRDSEDRCHWLEDQVQTQGSVFAEDAPGAPQERSSDAAAAEPAENTLLRERLFELEQILTAERTRRETAEEALRLTEDAKSACRDPARDFSIEMEAEEEWQLSLDPGQPLLSRKVKGGAAACRRWLRGRSLYFSRLLTGRARSRYFFLFYLFTLHLLLLMCLTGAL